MTAAARAQLDRAVSEAAFQRQVLGLARLRGWAGYHPLDSRGSEPGFPDLVLVRPPRLIFAELKSATGRVSRAQQDWLDLLGDCTGVAVHVWRPADWDEITAVLR